MNTIETFLQISIVGAFLSAVIEVIKNKYGTTSYATKILTIILSIALGAALYFLNGTAIWMSVVGVLAAASTVYAFLLK